MADCSDVLPIDVWHIIGEKLEVTADRIRFRSVCKAWRSVLPFPQPPWLMLAQEDCSPNSRGFFGVGDQDEQIVHQFDLPEMYQTRCFGSTGTWLITVDGEERMCLLNPFSRVQIDLPSQHNLESGLTRVEMEVENLTPEFLRMCLLRKAILSSPPSSSRSGDCIAMVIYSVKEMLAFARPGDASWTIVKSPISSFEDIIFYRNQFYAVNAHRRLVVCDLGVTPPKATLLTGNDSSRRRATQMYYLVEWIGELLLVVKHMHVDPKNLGYELNRFDVYKFDFYKKRWVVLDGLGEYSLFLGFNTSVAVLASNYPGLKTNCIYFTDDYAWGYLGLDIPGGRSMGVFNMEDSSIRPHFKGTSTSHGSPPLWIVPLTVNATEPERASASFWVFSAFIFMFLHMLVLLCFGFN